MMDEPEDESDRAIEKPVEPPQETPDPSSQDQSAALARKSIRALNFHDEQFNDLTRGTQIGALARMTGSGALRALAKELAPLTKLAEMNAFARAAELLPPSSRLLQQVNGGLGLAAGGGILARYPALEAFAQSSPGMALPHWMVFQEHSKIGQLMREQRWAGRWTPESIGLLAGRINRIAAPIGFDEEIQLIAERAQGLRVMDIAQGFKSTPGIESLLAQSAKIAQTLTKLSAFAGAVDTVGPLSATSGAALASILGDWQTRPDLPTEYWQRPSVRQRYYDEAEVDAGLIDASNGEAVEILVESGIIEGVVGGKTVSAIIEAGPINVRISASRPRIGAYRAITAFEIVMRDLISRLLMTAQRDAGDNPDAWFKQRVPGDVLKRARERRAEALRAGESASDPIAFVDLGDLIPIVTFGKNWPIFEPIFGSMEAFRVDMQRLNGIRRPTMHARPIDPVQLIEMALTISRMTSMIKAVHGWLPEWDEEY